MISAKKMAIAAITDDHDRPTSFNIDQDSTLTTAKSLLEIGLHPLPVSPEFPADLYPAKNKDGSIPVNDGEPKPAFTGKNPSFIGDRSIPHLISHNQFQENPPTESELKRWFVDPQNGLGYLAPTGSKYRTIDFDAKHFESPEVCQEAVFEWIGQYPELAGCRVERTRSGGFHILIEFEVPPDFTNFTLGESGSHCGEILGDGRFCVCAPTSDYSVIQDGNIPRIESADSIGLFPTAKNKKEAQKKSTLKPEKPTEKSIQLREKLCRKARLVLDGDDVSGDRRSQWFSHLVNQRNLWVEKLGRSTRGFAG